MALLFARRPPLELSSPPLGLFLVKLSFLEASIVGVLSFDCDDFYDKLAFVKHSSINPGGALPTLELSIVTYPLAAKIPGVRWPSLLDFFTIW